MQVAKFEFTIYTVPDGLYGVFDHETNKWNGIVKELLERNADIAVAPMTINYARLVGGGRICFDVRKSFSSNVHWVLTLPPVVVSLHCTL